MRSLAALFRPRPLPHAVAPAAEQPVLAACQSGNFAAAQALLASLPLSDVPHHHAELVRAMGTLLSHSHVRGMEWGHSENDRWQLVRRLKTMGTSVPQAFTGMPGFLRRLSASHWNTLIDWGMPLDESQAWKMWGAWVDDPILSESPPPEGEPRMRAAEALSTVRDMVARGLRADAVDPEGRTPLHVLCATARLRDADRTAAFLGWVDLLLSARASLDACDHDGNTVLHALCESQSAPQVPESLWVRLLSAHPHLIATRNRFGQLPVDVMRAVHRQHRRAVNPEPWLRRARWLQEHADHHHLLHTLPAAVEAPIVARRL